MRSFRHPFLQAAAFALPVVTLCEAAHAQAIVQRATPDADELAAQMRVLAVNALDVNALVRAGELTIKLGDPTAAAVFFARAERVDPRNARAKAGEGSLLVQDQRPGEALRRFGQAQSLGLDIRRFAADRGLAYDLIGEQERAQRDYRLALKAAPDDETSRRYALSLGISNKREAALAALDPLLRRSDRGAWRARAFILAMTGDGPGAERIATTMMPGGLAQGLRPFFERLPSLAPADRAFAVHFGELRPTPERIADARSVPALAPLQPEQGLPAPVAIAVQTTRPTREDRKSHRKARGRDRVEVAAATPPVPQPPPLPPPPAYGVAVTPPARAAPIFRPAGPPAQAALRFPPQTLSLASGTSVSPPPARQPVGRFPLPAVAPPPRGAILATSPPIVVAARTIAPSIAPSPARPLFTGQVAHPPGATAVLAANAPPAAVTTTAVTDDAAVPFPASVPAVNATARIPAQPQPLPQPLPTGTGTRVAPAAPTAVASPPVQASPVAVMPPPAVMPTPVVVPPRPGLTAPAPPVAVLPQPLTASGSGQGVFVTPAPIEIAAPPPAAVETTAPASLASTPTPVRSEDSILASIIADISVPGSELGVTPVRRRAAAPAAESAMSAPPEEMTAEPATRTKAVDARRGSSDGRPNDDGSAGSKKAAEIGKADARKTADAKKVADAKKAEAKKDPRILEPARIWVQVAGGANQESLAREWARVRAKAPAAFKGKQGWTTPLRATNRVLAGPFKSDDDARAFVNALAKEGLSGFTFSSEAGQKIEKLPVK